MSDDVLLQEGPVTVTTTRAVLAGTTYPVNGITSVRRSTDGPHRAGSVVLVLAGLATAGVGYVCGAGELGAMTGMGGIFGACLLLAGLFGFVTARAQYVVHVGTAGGDRRALVTRDRAQADRVRSAIEEAITRRG